MIVDDKYKTWVQTSTRSIRDGAQRVQDLIVGADSARYWRDADKVTRTCGPIVNLFDIVNGDTPCVSKVYHRSEPYNLQDHILL